MSFPLIGVTADYLPEEANNSARFVVREKYIQAVLDAGGVPVMIPFGIPESAYQNILNRIDGFLFTGGADIDPARFGGLPHPRVYDVLQARDELEIRLVRLAYENGFPFLGICRGIQVINVALGGTLYTDITDQMPNALRHDNYPNIPRDYLAHEVTVKEGSMLAGILGGEQFQVNSLHHQGIEKLSPELTAVACSPDNLVEAVEVPWHNFALGVQWHPEWLQAHEPQRRLFRAFVEAADTWK